jgi:hypothetical protein
MQKITKIIVTDIEWDTPDDIETRPPTRLEIDVTPETEYLLEDAEGDADALSDYISDLTGWYHFGFHVQLVEGPSEPTPDNQNTNITLSDELKSELINVVGTSFETGHLPLRTQHDFNREFSHLAHDEKQTAWKYYRELVAMGPSGFYWAFKDTYKFDSMFVEEYGRRRR